MKFLGARGQANVQILMERREKSHRESRMEGEIIEVRD